MKNTHIYSQIINIKDISKKYTSNFRTEKIYHMNAANPYESKYGDDWCEHIKNVKKLNKYVFITSLIKHIYDESRRIM